MEKLVPPNIFLLSKEESKNLSIKPEDFYLILLNKVKEKPGYYTLIIPETILKGFNLENDFLIHSDEGVLVYYEELNPQTVGKFLRRCSFYKKPSLPVCVCKYLNKHSKFESFVMKSLLESERLLNKKPDVILQRYIGVEAEVIFKARIHFIVSKNTYSGKILWKDSDSKFKIEKDDALNEDEIKVTKFFREQMNNLKDLLETESKKEELSEITADFMQDFNGNWYFIDIVIVKFEKKRYKTSNVKKNVEEGASFSENSVVDVQDVSLKNEIIFDFEEMLKPKMKHSKKGAKRVKFII